MLRTARWIVRLVVVASVCALAGLPAAPAFAHEVGGVGATNFRTTLTELAPDVPGLTLRVIENGSRLELRNDTGTEAVIAGYSDEPYARVGPAGVFVNDNSPATYLNESRFVVSRVPAGVDPKKPPVWRQVSREPVWRWHDHRIHWMQTTLPAAVAAAPTKPHRISDWTVVIDHGGTRVTAAGSLDWVPGPSPWPWFALALVLAGALAAAGMMRRPHRLLATAPILLVVAELVHGIGAAAVTAGTAPERLSALFGDDALLLWPAALLGGWLLWRGRTRAIWLAAGSACVMAGTLALDDAPVLWRSSAPSALPADLNRGCVAAVIGLGLGLVLTVPVLLRRHAGPARPWQPPQLAAQPEQPVGDTQQATAKQATGPDGQAEREPDQQPEPEPLDVAQRESGPAQTTIGRRALAGYVVAGTLGAFVGATAVATATSRRSDRTQPPNDTIPLSDVGSRSVPFYGTHQAGIATPYLPQAYGWVAAFDLRPAVEAAGLRDLLIRWSEAGARLAAGEPLGHSDDTVVAGLGPAALTVTIGFGPSLFGKAGIPESARPAALAPLPAFPGEQLDPAHSDGDLGVVVAADDATVVAHASRVLRRLAAPVARLRWQMRGFNSARGAGPQTRTPRNLMGQVDGTNNPKPSDPDFAERVFAQDPPWLRGGSYLVVRRIRMLLDEWDTLSVAEQERVIGRRKDTGAPLTGGSETTPANFGARGPDGSLVIPENAHIRLAAPAFNQGAAILRRSFSYLDGDEAGLLFLAWQADPRRGFIPVQQRLAAGDALGRFIRHETSALFAMPGGARQGEYVGQRLLEG